MIYLASPYSHRSTRMREQRYLAACRAAAKLMLQGNEVFCPISHSHGIAVAAGGSLDAGHYWYHVDAAMLRIADQLTILKLDGWDTSRGVKYEIEIAQVHAIPIRYVEAE